MARWPTAGNVYPVTPKAYPATPKAYPATLASYPSAGASPVTPASIMGASCVEWWRSDLGITIGTGVSAWAGQVGGKNFLQGTAASQLTYSATGGPNSTPSLLADGVDDSLDGDAIIRAVPTSVIWMIARQKSWTSAESIINDASATLALLQTVTTPQLRQFAGTSTNTNANATLNTWRRIQADFTNSTSDRLFIGSNNITGGNSGALDGSAPLLGRNSASSTFGHAEYCEVAFFNAIPSAGQLTALDAYVVARYGTGLT